MATRKSLPKRAGKMSNKTKRARSFARGEKRKDPHVFKSSHGLFKTRDEMHKWQRLGMAERKEHIENARRTNPGLFPKKRLENLRKRYG